MNKGSGEETNLLLQILKLINGKQDAISFESVIFTA